MNEVHVSHHRPPCSSLFHSCTLRHTRVRASRITLTHPLAKCWPSLLALCDDVTFFPPFKVDTGVFIPQPDTPDTPVSPYLSSPDEVTGSGWCGGWRRCHQTPALHRDLLSAPPPPFSFVCGGKSSPRSPAHSAGSMSPTHCTWHHRAHSNGNNQPPHSWSLMSISTVWTERLVVDFESSDQNTNISRKPWSEFNNQPSDAIA